MNGSLPFMRTIEIKGPLGCLVSVKKRLKYTLLNSYCWLALARQHTILVILCMLGILCCICGSRPNFWMSDLAHAVYDSVYFYFVIRLRELPFVIGLCEVAFLKSTQ